MLVYSDPQEDGYKKGKVDPDGPWARVSHPARCHHLRLHGPRRSDHARLGLSPGAKHIPIEDAVSAPKIMAMPLSWHDAKPLLENMDGPVAPIPGKAHSASPIISAAKKKSSISKIEMDNGLQL